MKLLKYFTFYNNYKLNIILFTITITNTINITKFIIQVKIEKN